LKDRDRTVLRDYLLGELPEAERSELGDRCFVDEGFFDQLLEVENELLDEYASGRLSTEDRTKFEDYLGNLPDGASKLATALVLSEAAREEQNVVPVSSSAALPISPPKWEIVSKWFLGGGQTLRYASIAIVIVLLAGIAYLVVTQRQLRRDLEQLSAERTQSEREKAQLSRDTQTARLEQAAQRDRIRELESQLAQERERQAQEISKRDGGVGAVLASLILTPSLRSTGASDVLTLPSTVKTVSLIMPVAHGEQITSYRAVLQTSEGQVVLAKEGLRAQASRRGRDVTIRLPAARLIADSYKLTLQGKAVDGVDIAQDYYFNIRRQ